MYEFTPVGWLKHCNGVFKLRTVHKILPYDYLSIFLIYFLKILTS